MKLSVTAGSLAALALTILTPLHGSDWALSGVMPGSHRGSINALARNGDTIISAGEDGFVEIWNDRKNTAEERFQLSPDSITAMAGRPEKDEVCLLENDGLGLYRITAWNYRERRIVFTQELREPIAYITYSMGGKFIIATGSGRSGVILLDSNSGDRLPVPQSLTGMVGAAVTGKSERNMLVYLTSGALSYWDLESGNETNYFEAPPELDSPVFFGNSRYLAGINADGLTVVYATSGELVAVDRTVPEGSLLCSSGDNLFCLIQNEDTAAQLNRYTVDRTGSLVQNGQSSLNHDKAVGRFTTMSAGTGSTAAVAMGTVSGSLLIAGMNGQIRRPVIQEQTGITETAVSGSTIAFIAEDGMAGFIPRDYRQFRSGNKIRVLKDKEAYNRVTAFAGKSGSGEQFIFWQDLNTDTPPLIQSAQSAAADIPLNDISFRSPIRSVGSFGGKILFQDSTGNITVVSPLEPEKKSPFNFFSVGLMDAIFVNQDQLLLGRSAVSDNTPFMLINITTGETVPLPYPAQAAVMLHRGNSGSIYAVTITAQSANNGNNPSVKTVITRFNPADRQDSVNLVDFQGEDTQFSFTELSGNPAGNVAATIGDKGAAIYSGNGNRVHKMERTAGLPLQLLDGGPAVISRDGDGAIAWHESSSGKLLAVFRLHPSGWTLQTEQRSIKGGF